MADDNNLDQEILDELERATREIQHFNRAVGVSRGDNTILNRADLDEQRRVQEKLQSERLRRQSLSIVGSSLVSLTTGIQSGGSSFKPVTNAISMIGRSLNKFASSFGTVGKLIGGVLEGVADSVNHVIDTFEKTYGGFEKLSETGLVDTFETVKDISLHTRLKIETLESALNKHSGNLAIFSGGALRGAQDFKKLASINTQNRERFFQMGFSIEEYAETQAQYLATMGRIMDTEDRGFKVASMNFPGYLENLVNLSRFTGKTREELKKELNDLTMDQRFRAWASGKTEKEAEKAQNIISAMEAFGGADLGTAIKEFIAADGSFAQNSEQAKKAYVTYKMGGTNIIDLVQKYMKGALTLEEVMQENKRTMQGAGRRIQESVAITGDLRATLKFADINKSASSQIGKFTKDEIERERERLKREQGDTRDEDLAKTRISMSDFGTSVQQLSMNATTVIKSFHYLTKGIDSIVDRAYELGGNELPEEVKVLRKQSKMVMEVQNLEIKADEITKKQRKTLEEINTLEEKNKKEKLNGKDALQLATLKAENQKFTKQKEDIQKNIQKLNLDINKVSSQAMSAGLTVSGTANAVSFGGGGDGGMSGGDGGGGGTTGGTERPPGGVIERLLSYIGKKEANGNYNILVGGKTHPGLTNMTIGQVLEFQRTMRSRGHESTAVGKYQMLNTTIEGLLKKGTANINDKFDPATQDKMATELMNERGMKKFLAGKMPADQIADNLSKVWAALPYRTGRSYYSGVGSNKSMGSREEYLSLFKQARTGGIFKGPSSGYLAMLHGDEIVIPANDEITKRNLQETVLSSDSEDSGILLNLFTMLDERVDDMIDLVADLSRSQQLYSKF